MNGRCPLCGANTNGSYCYAHAWAAGTAPPRRTYADGWNAHKAYTETSSVTGRPPGSSLSGYQPLESPGGRTTSRLQLMSAGNRQKGRINEPRG